MSLEVIKGKIPLIKNRKIRDNFMCRDVVLTVKTHMCWYMKCYILMLLYYDKDDCDF